MAKVTYVFGVLLILVGLVGYFGTGSAHPTALIPTWFGLALVVGGFLAISPSEGRRKLFMHINVTVGLVGFIGAIASASARLRARALARHRSRLQSADRATDHGRSAADLCESLRALVHPST